MRRRRLLKLGVVGSAAFGVVGGAAWLAQAPQDRLVPLSVSEFEVLAAIATALLEGSLPTEHRDRQAALPAYRDRLANAVSGLPPSTQRELAQVLSLMALAPARWALSGMRMPWPEASRENCRDALEAMRRSRWVQRRVVYHALRDLARAAWYVAPTTWAAMGYPGPLKVA